MSQWRLRFRAPLFFLGPTSYENVYNTVNGKNVFSLVKIGTTAGSPLLLEDPRRPTAATVAKMAPQSSEMPLFSNRNAKKISLLETQPDIAHIREVRNRVTL
jgi:hypothetical protein